MDVAIILTVVAFVLLVVALVRRDPGSPRRQRTHEPEPVSFAPIGDSGSSGYDDGGPGCQEVGAGAGYDGGGGFDGGACDGGGGGD